MPYWPQSTEASTVGSAGTSGTEHPGEIGRERGAATEHPTEDRRVRRTRQLLFEALIELILEKGYDKTTIQDIIDRADVGRSTFYAHYRDKDDLLLARMEEIRPAFEAADEGGDPSEAIFRHVGEWTHVYRAIAGRRGGQVILGQFRRVLTEQYTARLRARVDPSRQPAVPLDAVVEFLVSAVIALVQWGVDRDDPVAPERLHACFQTLVVPGVRKALGVTP